MNLELTRPNPIEKAVESKLLRCLSKRSVEAKNFPVIDKYCTFQQN